MVAVCRGVFCLCNNTHPDCSFHAVVEFPHDAALSGASCGVPSPATFVLFIIIG